MNTFAVLRPAAWFSVLDLEKSAGTAARVVQEEMAGRIRWIRSYVISHENGRLGMVCIYEAANSEDVREHAERSGLPVTEILPVRTTVVINDESSAAL